MAKAQIIIGDAGGGGTPLPFVAYDKDGIYETWDDVPVSSGNPQLKISRSGYASANSAGGALEVPSDKKTIGITANGCTFRLVVIDVLSNRYVYSQYADFSTLLFYFCL